MTSVDELLARAQSATGRGVLYWIGTGGQDPAAPQPASRVAVARIWAGLTPEQKAEFKPIAVARGIDVHDPDLILDACDCSGFVCWALGLARHARPQGAADDGAWINTDHIWDDAMGPGTAFQRLERARPGALVVYPKKDSGENYGHVGIVMAADEAGRATLVAHCSAANALSDKADAIQITPPEPFERQALSIYAWCRSVG